MNSYENKRKEQNIEDETSRWNCAGCFMGSEGRLRFMLDYFDLNYNILSKWKTIETMTQEKPFFHIIKINGMDFLSTPEFKRTL